MHDPWTYLAWVLLVAAALGLLANVIRYQHTHMDTDEAVHARDGQEYGRALRSLDLGRASQLLHQPQWHPPAYGGALGVWFSLFGTSVLAARLFSVLFYFLLGAVIWAATRDLCKEARGPLAFAAVLLFVLDVRHAAAGGVAMLEMPASFFAILSLWLFTRTIDHGGHRAAVFHALAAAAALTCFFTRYAHGLAALGALGLAHLWMVLITWRRAGARSLILPAALALAVAAIAGTWLFGFGQLDSLLAYSEAQPRRIPRWSLANLGFYPAYVFAKTPFGPVVLGAFVVSLAWAVRSRRLHVNHAVWLIYLLLGFAILFLVRQKAQRFGLLVLTPLWILTAACVAALLQRRERVEHWLRSSAIAIAVTLLGYLAYYRNPFPNTFENVDDGLARMYRSVGEVIEPWKRPKTTALVLGRDDLRSSAALAFSMEAECERRRSPCEVVVYDEIDVKLGWPRRAVSPGHYRSRLGAAMREADFIVAYDRGEHVAQGRPLLMRRRFDYRRKQRSELTTLSVAVHGALTERAAR